MRNNARAEIYDCLIAQAVSTLCDIVRDTAASQELALDALGALKVAIPADGDGDSAFIRVVLELISDLRDQLGLDSSLRATPPASCLDYA